GVQHPVDRAIHPGDRDATGLDLLGEVLGGDRVVAHAARELGGEHAQDHEDPDHHEERDAPIVAGPLHWASSSSLSTSSSGWFVVVDVPASSSSASSSGGSWNSSVPHPDAIVMMGISRTQGAPPK